MNRGRGLPVRVLAALLTVSLGASLWPQGASARVSEHAGSGGALSLPVSEGGGSRGGVSLRASPLPAAGRAAQPAAYVILDPGHGGRDRGAPEPELAARCGVEGEVLEKERTLEVARQLGAILESRGVRVVLTREADVTLSLRERSDLVNREQPDLLVSLHANAAPSCGSGVEVWYSSLGSGSRPNPHLASSRRLAERIAQALHGALGLSLRRSGGTADARGGLAMVREPLVPSVLVEMAFISNPGEAALLRDRAPDFAWAIAEAILEHLEAEE